MKAHETFLEFIDAAKNQGVPDDSLVGLLRARGWPEDAVYEALAVHYQNRTGLEIPVRKRSGAAAKNSDFSGCYVLIRDGEPFYVGISRGVVGRLRQHGRGKTEFEATLAYRMACEKSRHKMTRSEAMKDSKFRKKFQEAQGLLNGSKVAFIEIENSLELDLFEAYCAIELNTSKWNTFRTQLELLRFRNECQASKTA